MSEIGKEKEFREAMAAGKWRIQKSPSTGAYVYYPREIAPGSGADDLEWVEPSGLGTLYSYTIVNRRAEQGGPYNVILVDLDEGPRMMARLEGVENDAIEIGARVKARLSEIGGKPAVVFDLATGA